MFDIKNKDKITALFQFLIVFIVLTVLLCGCVYKLSLWLFASETAANLLGIFTVMLSLAVGIIQLILVCESK